MHGKGELRATADQQLFIRFDDLAVFPSAESIASTIDRIRGQWLRIPASPKQAQNPITPDQQWIELQAQVVNVDRDLGMQPMPDGSLAYHYVVSLDPSKLAEVLSSQTLNERKSLQSLRAKGELFIDSRTFILSKAVWHVEGIASPSGAIEGQMTMELARGNDEWRLDVPDAAIDVALPAFRDFDRISTGALLPQPKQVSDTVGQ